MSRSGSSRSGSGKRKSSSVHWIARNKKLHRCGFSMALSIGLERSAKHRCEDLVQASRGPSHQIPMVLQRAQDPNSGRLYRVVTAQALPSATHSYLNSQTTLDYLIDEVPADRHNVLQGDAPNLNLI